MKPAFVWTSNKNEWNAHNAIWSPFDHRLDLLSLVIWSRKFDHVHFWPPVTWNFCKAQCWSKSILTFEHCRNLWLLPIFMFNFLIYKKPFYLICSVQWLYEQECIAYCNCTCRTYGNWTAWVGVEWLSWLGIKQSRWTNKAFGFICLICGR